MPENIEGDLRPDTHHSEGPLLEPDRIAHRKALHLRQPGAEHQFIGAVGREEAPLRQPVAHRHRKAPIAVQRLVRPHAHLFAGVFPRLRGNLQRQLARAGQNDILHSGEALHRPRQAASNRHIGALGRQHEQIPSPFSHIADRGVQRLREAAQQHQREDADGDAADGEDGARVAPEQIEPAFETPPGIDRAAAQPAQRDDGIQLRCLPGGISARNHAHHRAEGDDAHRQARRQREKARAHLLHQKVVGEQSRTRARRHAHQPANAGDEHRFGDHFGENVPIFCAERLLQPDLAAALLHAHDHGIHNGKSPDEQRDDAAGAHNQREDQVLLPRLRDDLGGRIGLEFGNGSFQLPRQALRVYAGLGNHIDQLEEVAIAQNLFRSRIINSCQPPGDSCRILPDAHDLEGPLLDEQSIADAQSPALRQRPGEDSLVAALRQAPIPEAGVGGGRLVFQTGHIRAGGEEALRVDGDAHHALFRLFDIADEALGDAGDARRPADFPQGGVAHGGEIGVAHRNTAQGVIFRRLDGLLQLLGDAADRRHREDAHDNSQHGQRRAAFAS